jgi:hypothetical protein
MRHLKVCKSVPQEPHELAVSIDDDVLAINRELHGACRTLRVGGQRVRKYRWEASRQSIHGRVQIAVDIK